MTSIKINFFPYNAKSARYVHLYPWRAGLKK